MPPLKSETRQEPPGPPPNKAAPQPPAPEARNGTSGERLQPPHTRHHGSTRAQRGSPQAAPARPDDAPPPRRNISQSAGPAPRPDRRAAAPQRAVKTQDPHPRRKWRVRRKASHTPRHPSPLRHRNRQSLPSRRRKRRNATLAMSATRVEATTAVAGVAPAIAPCRGGPLSPPRSPRRDRQTCRHAFGTCPNSVPKVDSIASTGGRSGHDHRK